MNHKTTRIASLLILIGTIIISAGITYVYLTRYASKHYKATELIHTTLQTLYAQKTWWEMQHLHAIFDRKEFIKELFDRLIQNIEDTTSVFAHFYGQPYACHYKELRRTYLLAQADAISAYSTHMHEQYQQAVERLYTSAQQLATLLSKITGAEQATIAQFLNTATLLITKCIETYTATTIKQHIQACDQFLLHERAIAHYLADLLS